MSDRAMNNTVDERLQVLLAQHAATQARQEKLQAEIAMLLPSSAPASSFPHHRFPAQKQHQQRPRNVPRSMPPNGTTMARHHSSDRVEKSSSQRSAPSMARASSKGSSSGRASNLALISTMAPPLLTDCHRENSTDQPWSLYTYHLQPPTSQRKPDLDQVLENVGEDPAAFISRTGGTPTRSSPISIPSSSHARNRSSLGTPLSYSMPTPTTPMSSSLTNATTLTSGMSRQNSFCNDPLLGGMKMLKFDSNTSFLSTDHNVDHNMSEHVIPHYTSSRQNRRSSDEEQSHLLRGAGGASHDSHFSQSFPTAEDVVQLQSSPFSGERMEKSQSNESISSLSSSSSRSKERLKAQIQTAASRPLAPKRGSDEHAASRTKPSQSMKRFESMDGSQEEIAMSKPTYQRPKHDRVFCKECEDHPDGFRGEHELRRHQDRQHKKMVKKWVCVQPIGPEHPKPDQPLSRCKACAQQKKKYNAYYNAAAHLRRAHFRPKAKGRTKSSRVDEAERRGGKGGGDWPPMPELKHWMMEVEELATDYPSATSQQGEADESDDEGVDMEETSPTTTSSVAGGSFDQNPYITPDASFNTYPSPTNNALFSMQSMQGLDLSQHLQPNNDSSVSCSQNSFDNFPFHQNDPLAFSDNPSLFLPHQAFDSQFDDQLLGLDPVQFPFQ